jgi:hypothetical protein
MTEKSDKEKLFERLHNNQIPFSYQKCLELELAVVKIFGENNVTPEESLLILESIRMFVYTQASERCLKKVLEENKNGKSC